MVTIAAHKSFRAIISTCLYLSLILSLSTFGQSDVQEDVLDISIEIEADHLVYDLGEQALFTVEIETDDPFTIFHIDLEAFFPDENVKVSLFRTGLQTFEYRSKPLLYPGEYKLTVYAYLTTTYLQGTVKDPDLEEEIINVEKPLAKSSLSIQVNAPPVALNQNLTLNEDNTIDITLTGTDPDSDGSNLDFRIKQVPTHGQLTGTPPLLTYHPNKNYFGLDQFTFIVNDGRVDSQEATIALHVQPVNDPPEIVTISPPSKTWEGKLYHYYPQAVDPEGNAIKLSLAEFPQGMIFNSSLARIEWTPQHSQVGNHKVVLKAEDPQGLMGLQTYTLSVQLKPENANFLTIGKAILDPEADLMLFETRLDVENGQIHAQHLVVMEDAKKLGFPDIDHRRYGLNINTATGVDIKSPFFADSTGKNIEFDVIRSNAQWVLSYYEERGPLEPEFGHPKRNSRPVAAYAWGSVENMIKNGAFVSFDLILDSGLIDGTKSFGTRFYPVRGVRVFFDLESQTGKIEKFLIIN